MVTQLIGVLIAVLLFFGGWQMTQITNQFATLNARFDRLEGATNGLTGTTATVAILQAASAASAANDMILQKQLDAMFTRLAVAESRIK